MPLEPGNYSLESREQRRANVHLIAYNTRFLILSWVQVPHLASHLLGRLARVISADWQQLYAHPIYLLESFIDPQRFSATCYRAANWIYRSSIHYGWPQVTPRAGLN